MPANRDPVRARDGLRGLPRLPDAGELRPYRPRTGVDRHRLRPRRSRRDCRGADHDRRLGGFVLDDDPIVKSIGLSLAFGVLVDAFVVRMTLVPAVMALLGRKAWWLPRRLERRIPGGDLEGEGLLANLEEAPART